MKKYLSVAAALVVFPLSVNALSFAPGTAFVPLDCLDNESSVAYWGTSRVAQMSDKTTISGSDLSFTPSSTSTSYSIDNFGTGGSMSWKVSFDPEVTDGWFTGFSFDQTGDAGLSKAPGFSWFDAEIFKNGDLTAPIWHSYGASGAQNQITGTTINEDFNTFGRFDWEGSTYTPTNEGFRIDGGDTFELRLTYNTDNKAQNNTWGVNNLYIQAACIECVPEPSSALLGGIAAMLLIGRRRRG